MIESQTRWSSLAKRVSIEMLHDKPASRAEKSRNVAYWVATILLAAELGLGGVWDILRVPQVQGVIHRLGYPAYFLVILGVWKLLGTVALVVPRFPRLKEWAYAGVIFNYTSAVASHLASGLMDVGALIFLAVMTVITVGSWALRPPSRRNFPPN